MSKAAQLSRGCGGVVLCMQLHVSFYINAFEDVKTFLFIKIV